MGHTPVPEAWLPRTRYSWWGKPYLLAVSQRRGDR